MDGMDRLAEKHGEEIVQQALDDAVAAILTEDESLEPSRVLGTLDWDDSLCLAGGYADKISAAAFVEAEKLFLARLMKKRAR